MKYRKKPVAIEAFQYDGDLIKSDGKYYVPDWAVEAFEKRILFYANEDSKLAPCELFVKTLEGSMHVSVNDYVIKGVDGELYPCKPNIFEKTYDKEEPHSANIETYQSITGIILKAEPAVRIGELNYTETEQQPQTGERREQGYRVYFKSGAMTWMDKETFEMLNTKVLFPERKV